MCERSDAEIARVHTQDQAMAATADQARLTATHYKTLVDNGVPEQIAMVFTQQWFVMTINRAGGQ